MFAIFFFVLTVHLVSGQVTNVGPCPDVETVKNFSVEKYLGLWYEVRKYPNRFSNGKCITAYYALNANGTVSVLNTQVVNDKQETISGSARLISSGVLGVLFPNNPSKSETSTNLEKIFDNLLNKSFPQSTLNLTTRSWQLTTRTMQSFSRAVASHPVSLTLDLFGSSREAANLRRKPLKRQKPS